MGIQCVRSKREVKSLYLADCHNHTCCSGDSDAPLELVLQQAARMGLSHVCTTDHMDLVSREGDVLEDWDWTAALEQHERAQQSAPKGVEVRLGAELNSAHLYTERNRRLIGQAPLDLVVGSVHNTSPKLGGEDFILWQYTDEQTCFRALDDYFDSLITLSGVDYIDVLAHIPYTLRYMTDRDGIPLSLERYRPQLEVIFTNLIRRGAGIEVNTNRGKSLADYRDLLAQYRQLGGEIVTIGTDAHRPEDIGKGVREAAELLRELGYRYYTVYRRRRPEFIPL